MTHDTFRMQRYYTVIGVTCVTMSTLFKGLFYKAFGRQGIYNGGTYRPCGGVQDPDKRTADEDILKHHHHVQRHFINEGFKG